MSKGPEAARIPHSVEKNPGSSDGCRGEGGKGENEKIHLQTIMEGCEEEVASGRSVPHRD